MRIVHVIQSLDPAQGGPPMVASRLAAAQAALGHEVVVVRVAEPEAADRVREALAGLPGGDRITLVEVPAPRLPLKLVGRSIVRECGEAMAGADIVHLHGLWDPVLHSAGCAARRRGVPYVVCLHGMLDPWPMQQRRFKKRLAMLSVAGELLRGAAFVQVLTEQEISHVRMVGVRKRCEVVANGVFGEEFEASPDRSAFERAHPELGGDPYVLFLSRLHKVKGVDVLVEAFAQVAGRVPGIRLVIAGPDAGVRSDIERRVEELGIADRTHFVGPQYGRQKYEALAGCSVFCLPSRQEAFSVAIVEALASGVPVVISEECRFPEVEREGAGVVTKLRADAIAEGLERVLADEGGAALMGRAARRLVMERYTWTRLAESLIGHYASVCGGSVMEQTGCGAA